MHASLPTPWACEGPVTWGAVHRLLPPFHNTESQTRAERGQLQERDAAGAWGPEPAGYAPFHKLRRRVPPPRCAPGPAGVNDTRRGQRGGSSSPRRLAGDLGCARARKAPVRLSSGERLFTPTLHAFLRFPHPLPGPTNGFRAEYPLTTN